MVEAVLADIRSLRRGFARLRENAAVQAEHPDSPWRPLYETVRAAHRRAEQSLLAAAERDGVWLPPQEAPSPDEPAEAPKEESAVICQWRRLSRDLEEQSASTATQVLQLGWDHLAEVLGHWRRELIGFEQPLIALHASTRARHS